MNFSAARILVVDDNPENRDVLARRLRRLDLTDVSQAADGIEALKLIRAQSFDLMLLDVMMPHMNGIEVLEVMKAEGRLDSTPVVMISAASEIETVVRCIELGAEDYLPKPFSPALLAARVRTVIEKKFLRAENRQQLDRLEREMAEARANQLSMLPQEFPVDPEVVDIHALIDPALEVGGDLYDVFEITAGLICVAVGDVAGKGASAALFMARARSLLRAGTLQYHAISGRVPRPSDIARLVNDELCKNNPHSTFVTLFLGFFDITDGSLSFCNAGHVPPLICSAHGVREIRSEPDPALGALEGIDFVDHALDVAIGETLLLTSDGLADMLNEASESFGNERVLSEIATVAEASAKGIVEHVVSAARAFAGAAPQFDDVTLLGIRRLR